jgi:hypothetical protein
MATEVSIVLLLRYLLRNGAATYVPVDVQNSFTTDFCYDLLGGRATY